MKDIDKLVYCFFVFVFVAAHVFGWYDVTTPIYERGIVENREGAFVLPLLYWVGVPAHQAIGENAFVALPLFFMLVSVFFILRAFNLFGWQKELIFLAFIITPRWIPTLMFFNRDNLLFMFASAFSYFFFKAIYKKDSRALVWQALLVLAMLFTKAAGSFFLLIFVLELIYFYREKLSFFPIAFIGQFENLWQQHYPHVASSIIYFPLITLQNSLSFIANPIFGANALTFSYKRKEFPQLVILVLTLLAFGSMFAMNFGENYIGRFLRYANPLIPLHLFSLAYVIGPIESRKRWVKVFVLFFVAKVLSGFFYKDALFRLFFP